MTGVKINVKIEDAELKKTLSDIQGRIQNLKPAMEIIGTFVRNSIQKNFELGGRPTPWKPSQRALKTGDKTLIKGKFLMNSFTIDAKQDSVEVGTNKKYAAIHQFGGPINHPARQRTMFFKKFKSGERKGLTRFSKESKAGYGMKVPGKAYTINMPARPFMMVQEGDWTDITTAVSKYLTGLG